MDYIWETPLRHPEIETRAFARDQLRYSLNPYQPETSVSVFEVKKQHSIREATYTTGLNHDELVKHVQKDRGVSPELRILFFDTIIAAGNDTVYPWMGYICLHPSTALWLGSTWNVSPIFFAAVTTDIWFVKTGNALFKTYDAEGKMTFIDGFYRCSSGLGSLPVHVWFRHSLETRQSLYIMYNCPQDIKDSFIRSTRDRVFMESILRPMVVDAMVCEDCCDAWKKEIVAPRRVLVDYESDIGFSRRRIDNGTEQEIDLLHTVSHDFYRLKEDLTDLQELLKYLISVHEVLSQHMTGFHGSIATSIESLKFLDNRTNTWTRWVVNYINRVEICINRLFHLTNQRDNRTNLKIAHFTSKMAVETQKDSSSMITIAAVTMFFLPGTFVSGVFSTIFFDTSTDSEGKMTFSVSPWAWYFPAATIPLTILVFMVWKVWVTKRNKESRYEPESPAPSTSSSWSTKGS